MSAIYYVIDPNGEIYSEDKSTRFKALKGASLDAFIKSNESKKRYFSRTRDAKDNLISVEIPKDKVSEFEAQRLHSLYLSKYEDDYQILSLDAPISEDEAEPLESQIADPDEDVFEKVAKKETRDSVRRALKVLTEKELMVIVTMYLGEEELSEREVSKAIGMPYMTVHDVKIRALKKLRKFF